MRALPLTTAFLCALCVVVLSAGCKSKRPPKPTPPPVAVISIRAKPDANPGPDGRPSPVVLRLYQLKADAAFIKSDYFPLFDDEKKVLGGDLLSREEQELFPGQTLSLEIPFAPETRFIAVAGGYHDTGSASWRAIAPASGNTGHSVHVTAVAERAGVSVSVTP
jgi:type VI secretion system protein VasD